MANNLPRNQTIEYGYYIYITCLSFYLFENITIIFYTSSLIRLALAFIVLGHIKINTTHHEFSNKTIVFSSDSSSFFFFLSINIRTRDSSILQFSISLSKNNQVMPVPKNKNSSGEVRSRKSFMELST